MRRMTVTRFREKIGDLVDEVEVTRDGRHIGTWLPSVWQVATHTPPRPPDRRPHLHVEVRRSR